MRTSGASDGLVEGTERWPDGMPWWLSYAALFARVFAEE